MRRVLVSLWLLVFVPIAQAEQAAWISSGLERFSGKEIREISFLTWINLSHEDLSATVPLRQGSRLTLPALRESIESLYLRDMFEHVEPRVRPVEGGVALQFVLTPALRIDEVVIEGVAAFPVERLERRIGLRPGMLLDMELLKRAKERILSEYRSEGFYHAQVTFTLEEQVLAPLVTARVEVDEGYRSRIARLVLEGPIPEDVQYLRDRLDEYAVGLPGARDTVESLRRDFRLALRREGYLQASVEKGEIVYEPLSGDVTVTLHVATRDPISIEFKGNQTFSNEELLQPLKLDTREVPFSPNAIFRLTEALRELYQRHGFYFATVEAAQVPSDTTRRRYAVTIHEGERWHIDDIVFHGNELIPTAELRALLGIQERGWFLLSRWWPGYLVDEQLAGDVEAIRDSYQARGIRDVAVETEVQQGESAHTLSVVFRIKEQLPSVIRDVAIVWRGILDAAPTAEGIEASEAELLSLQSTLEVGAPLAEAAVEQERRRLMDVIGEQGFPNVQIGVEVTQAVGAVRFIVTPGPPIRVGRIWIQGNTYTHDEVIKKDLRFAEGEPWNQQAVEQSQRALYGLGFFRRVEVGPLDGTLDGPVEDVRVRVIERDTGSVELGTSFTTEDGLFVTSQLAQRNLFGYGSAVILGVDGFFKSGSRLFDAGRARIAYARPHIFDSATDLSLEGFLHSNVNLVEQFSYDRLGSSALLRYTLLENTKASGGFTAFHERLFDIEDDIIIGPDDNGSTFFSFLEGAIEYDARDNPYNPRSGTRTALDVRLATTALASEVNLLALDAAESLFLPLGRRWVWANHLRAVLLEPFGETSVVPLGQRVFLGGRQSLRGFSKNAIGPRGTQGTIAGGDRSLNLQSELRYDFTESVVGLAFLDVGQAFLANEGSFEGIDTDLGDLRLSPGVGVHYKTPIGPISVELGFATDREFGERWGRLNVGVGAAF
ncbi:MAG: BamA/TamA family outer membrane protein [Bdellovibrionales bacterium]|nr:BamA/TamA family outer membrane protein [Bdellovibrionales bacterium]